VPAQCPTAQLPRTLQGTPLSALTSSRSRYHVKVEQKYPWNLSPLDREACDRTPKSLLSAQPSGHQEGGPAEEAVAYIATGDIHCGVEITNGPPKQSSMTERIAECGSPLGGTARRSVTLVTPAKTIAPSRRRFIYPRAAPIRHTLGIPRKTCVRFRKDCVARAVYT